MRTRSREPERQRRHKFRKILENRMEMGNRDRIRNRKIIPETTGKNAQNHGRQNGQNNQNNQNNQNRKKSEPRDGYTLQELMNKWKI